VKEGNLGSWGGWGGKPTILRLLEGPLGWCHLLESVTFVVAVTREVLKQKR
jgi:hypothetical protein